MSVLAEKGVRILTITASDKQWKHVRADWGRRRGSVQEGLRREHGDLQEYLRAAQASDAAR